MSDNPTLDELPDRVFVSLGRRGMEPLPLKECTYDCDGKELNLIEVHKDPVGGKGLEEVEENWLVECTKCNRRFTIQCIVRYNDGERIDTRVNLIDDTGKNLGWLGSY
ncbi:MAG: hypothetical protein ACFFFO_08740 [Candidatus Thorarchaeota archaeon]